MGWLDEVGSLLKQYTGGSDDNSDTGDKGDTEQVEDHFDQVAESAPSSVLGQGISQALQSGDLPPIGQVISGLFHEGDSDQKAGLLNTLISSIGPKAASEILGDHGASDAADALDGGQTEVTPDQADDVPAHAIHELASQAAEGDSSVLDEVGGFLSGHPDLVKSLGSSGLGSILSNLAEKHLGG